MGTRLDFAAPVKTLSPFFWSPLLPLKQSPPDIGRVYPTLKMAVPDEVLSRLGEAKNLKCLSDDDLKAVLKEYYDRWVAAEGSKYDVERDVHIKEMQIYDLEMEVSDMRGKFILPKLKKVHNFKLMGGEE